MNDRVHVKGNLPFNMSVKNFIIIRSIIYERCVAARSLLVPSLQYEALGTNLQMITLHALNFNSHTMLRLIVPGLVGSASASGSSAMGGVDEEGLPYFVCDDASSTFQCQNQVGPWS